MRVVLVGAGALGSVYGARLASAGCAVEVVGRRAGAAAPRRLERVGEGAGFEWETGRVHDAVPGDPDAVLVAVPYPELAAASARIGRGAAPVVVLSPMFARDQARLEARLPGRVVAAMPSAVAYSNPSGVIRHWLPRGVSTLVERRSPSGNEEELVRLLAQGGIPARLERGVLTRNVATTVSFMPLAMAIDAAGGLDAALRDADLRALALEAIDESAELGRAIGKPEPWAGLLLRFVGPLTLRAGVAMAHARAPEVLAYIDDHFARKLHRQNVEMGAAMVELARERGLRSEALERLLARLDRRAP